jgi:chaperone BCS1
VDIQSLAGNQVVTGGLLLVVTGAVLALCRNVPTRLGKYLLGLVTVSVEVLEKDESYHWVQMWLSGKMRTNRSMTVYTRHSDPRATPESGGQPIDNRPKVFFTPSKGTHWFWYRGRPVVVTKTREQAPSGGAGMSGRSEGSLSGDKESITIRIFGRRRSIAQGIVHEARDLALPRDGRIDVRVSQSRWQGQWLLADRVRPRPLDSVIYHNDMQRVVLKDVQEFLNAYDWYAGLGIPYRRGYLLYGPPGGGKTSLVVAIASYLGMNIYVLNLASAGMSDSKLVELLSSVSENSIVLMEDIDCAFHQRKSVKEDGIDDGQLTFSGVLNALDGVGGKDGRIVFMTTNHVELLDPALVRPGRIDVQVHVGNATAEQATRLFERFYWGVSPALVKGFRRQMPDGEVSMATVQGHLMKYKSSPGLAVEKLYEITRGEKPKETPQEDKNFVARLGAVK